MRARIAWMVWTLSALAVGCGGGGGPAEPRVRQVVISFPGPTVLRGDTVALRAQVLGTGEVPQAVRWSLIPPSPTLVPATVDPDGTLHVERVIPECEFTVRATSVAAPEISGTARLTVPRASVTILPSDPAAPSGGTLQLSAVVEGTVDQRVEWGAMNGRIDDDGLFHATDPFTVSRASVDAYSRSTGASAEVPVRILIPTPALDGPAGPARPGERVDLPATGFFSHVTARAWVRFPAAAGAPVYAEAGVTETGLWTVVPLGATSGPLTAEFRVEGYDPMVTNAVDFVRAPMLRLHPAQGELAGGEATRLDAVPLGAAAGGPIDLSADAGAVQGGTYVAPAVSAPRQVTLRACLRATGTCVTQPVGVRPFRIAPAPALVPAGGTVRLSARGAAGDLGAAFSLLRGGGSAAADGTLRGPAALADSAATWLEAEAGGQALAFPVGVTGLTPGLLGRDRELVDFATGGGATAPEGSEAVAAAADGSRLFVARELLRGDVDDRGWKSAYTWIDTYDLADPVRPRWLGAVEAVARITWMGVGGGHLYTWSGPYGRGWVRPGVLASYGLSGPLPAPLGTASTPAYAQYESTIPSLDGEHLFLFGQNPSFGGPARIWRYDVLDGGLASPAVLDLAVPPGSDGFYGQFAVRGDRLHALCLFAGPQGEDAFLGAWDLSTSPPALLGQAEFPDWAGSVSEAGPVVLAGHTLYGEVGGALAQLLQLSPREFRVVASQGDRHALLSPYSGLSLLDTSTPGAPRVYAMLDPGTEARGSAALRGDHLYVAEGLGGVAVYAAAVPGGPVHTRMNRTPGVWVEANHAQAVQGGYLYSTGGWWLTEGVGPYGLMAVRDLSRDEAPTTWHRAPLDEGPWYGLAVDGERLVRAGWDGLEVWSLADPAAPALRTATSLPSLSVVLDGDVAWVGAISGDLVALDLAAPGGPVELARLPMGAYPYALARAGAGRLAVGLTDELAGDLVLVDVSSPARPRLLGGAGLGAGVYAVAIQGGAAFLATPFGLQTADVSTDAPRPLALVPLPADGPFGAAPAPVPAGAVAIDGGIAWVGGCSNAGVIAGFDARDPEWPRPVARTAFGGGYQTCPASFAFDRGRGFVGATWTSGMLQLDLTRPRNVVVTDEPWQGRWR